MTEYIYMAYDFDEVRWDCHNVEQTSLARMIRRSQPDSYAFYRGNGVWRPPPHESWYKSLFDGVDWDFLDEAQLAEIIAYQDLRINNPVAARRQERIRKVWEVPDDATRHLATHPAIAAFLGGAEIATANVDMQMRLAEFADVIDCLAATRGFRYSTRSIASAEPFDDYSGGGFGICTFLRDVVLDEILNRTELPRAAVPEPLTPEVQARLGRYVYALRDPRDHSIFSVRRGRGNAVYKPIWDQLGYPKEHSEGVRDSPSMTDPALRERIWEIANAGLAVEHLIVASGLPTRSAANSIVRAFIAGLLCGETSEHESSQQSALRDRKQFRVSALGDL